MNGELLTASSIRLSLLAYSAVLVGLLGVDWRANRVLLRWMWTVGLLLLTVHVLCAFHFYHDWNHSHAVRQTAEETESLLGWRFGGGVYCNYALILVWCVDVIWWWIASAGYEQRHWSISALLHGYIFLIAFNGAVVFEQGPTRWFGCGVTAVIVVLLLRRALARISHAPDAIGCSKDA